MGARRVFGFGRGPGWHDRHGLPRWSGNLERDAVNPIQVACKAACQVRAAGASAPVALQSRRQSERKGALRGNKAHGWIGCAASETAAVHYGLVSGVKPCSWAFSSPTSSSRHLATGGAGARRGKPIPGGVLLAAHHRNPEASISQPGLVIRHLRGLARGRRRTQLAAARSASRPLERARQQGLVSTKPGGWATC
jgi:hypothetical protein